MADDWMQLPQDLLQLIANKLATVYSDYVRFRAVCPQGGSSVPRVPRHLPPQFPWLMLPLSESHLQYHRSFYGLSTDQTHHIYLPEASRPELRVDSSNGWLVIFNNCKSSAILVLNPVTLDKHHLPPLSSFPNIVSVSNESYTIRKANDLPIIVKPIAVYQLSYQEMRDFFIRKILFVQVNKDNFVAVAIINKTGELAYCKKGDKRWAFMDRQGRSWTDVAYYNGKFYAVNLDGSRVGEYEVLNVNGRFSTVSVVIILVPGARELISCYNYFHSVYLVNSADELLLVVRVIDHHQFQQDSEGNALIRTVCFGIYRFNLIRLRTGRWDKVNDLGDRLLFVGENSCVSSSLSAVDVRGCLKNPRYNGCLKNCIYFMDDSRRSGNRNRGFRGKPYYDGRLPIRSYFISDSRVVHCHDADKDRGIFKLTDGLIIPSPCRMLNPSRALWITPTP
ncbi:hypothetical protein FH972_014022 [Carpinus fangiana]|uniref:KIB1-4 beta-propeller domain-containing protein n=1 Tax=Carpinus fangiana TaxID=176857 RepID=A0A5N6R9I9_9ROSI|nr:hypothetical protein FH972_014022 [Carpinus fangiana]